MTSPSQAIPHESERAVDSTADTQEAVPLFQKLVTKLQFSRRGRSGRGRAFGALPQPSQERLDASLTDVPLDTDKLLAAHPLSDQKEKSVLYLAYGSNLCKETFRGARGIRPLSQVNVLVPSLRLTFDLPGVPYSEPCFANTARRIPDDASKDEDNVDQKDGYHKDRWHKGLVGVVYEVTLSDYAHIIATEGGGSAYHDILVDCYVLPHSDTVPQTPTSKPFKSHTLFAPNIRDDGTHTTDRVTRPDPSYAQPSARYLKLITDGAAECEFPAEYKDYLHDIRPYTITTKMQAIGKAIFAATWMPLLLFVFALSKQFSDEKGRAPKWVANMSALVFKGMWTSYDGAFKRSFGDGERTIGDDVIAKHKFREETQDFDHEKIGLLQHTV